MKTLTTILDIIFIVFGLSFLFYFYYWRTRSVSALVCKENEDKSSKSADWKSWLLAGIAAASFLISNYLR
jgi:hypothetical protein